MKKILNLEEIANSEKNKWNYLVKSKNKDDLLYHTILNINSKGKILQKLFIVKINNKYKEILVWDMTISELLPSLFWIDYEWFFRDFGKVNTSDMCLRISEDSVENINMKKEKYNNFLKKHSFVYPFLLLFLTIIGKSLLYKSIFHFYIPLRLSYCLKQYKINMTIGILFIIFE